MNYVLRPSFFQDDLATRINNIMLVSALLITISASAFMESSSTGDNSENDYRAYSYLMFLSTIMFIVSIFLGIGFVESCLSRNYIEVDRLRAILKHYGIFGASQTFMMLGSATLLFGLVLSSALNHKEDDTIVFGIFSGLVLVVLIIILSVMADYTSKNQKTIVMNFQSTFCKPDGHLKEELIKWLDNYVIPKKED